MKKARVFLTVLALLLGMSVMADEREYSKGYEKGYRTDQGDIEGLVGEDRSRKEKVDELDISETEKNRGILNKKAKEVCRKKAEARGLMAEELEQFMQDCLVADRKERGEEIE